MVNSHALRLVPGWNFSELLHARRSDSWTRSSASETEPDSEIAQRAQIPHFRGRGCRRSGISFHQRSQFSGFSYPETRPNTHRKRSLGGRRWRVPRLHSSGGGVVSLCQYSGALLQRLSRRHRRPARSSADGFNAWFEAFLGDRWFTFDARHNQPRIGRILISRGRDAADIAMITTLGSDRLTRFAVVTEEIKERASVAA